MKELVDYFIQETNHKYDKLDQKVETIYSELKKDMQVLINFRYQIVGGTIALSLFISVIFNIIVFIYKK